MRRSERLTLMTAWEKSGLTKKAYCEQEKINYGTFISWFKSEKRLSKAQSVESKGKFNPITIENPLSVNKVMAQLPNGVELHFEKFDLTILKMLSNV